MSGGHFNYFQGQVADTFGWQWEDEEINALFADLFGTGWYGDDDCIDLAHSLDWWKSGDYGRDQYEADVQKFKRKWIGRTPKQRAEFYAEKLQERCDELKKELGNV